MDNSESLRIALWDEPRLKDFGTALQEAGAEVSYADRATCEKRLGAGLSDIALMPSHRAMSVIDAFQVLPAVAFSAWNTPHATLTLREGFSGRPEKVLVPDLEGLETLVARIVLKEHYGIHAAAEQVEGPMAASPEAAVLHVNSETRISNGLELDLGQEWFELTNYPMVWGLFVMRAGELDTAVMEVLRAAAASIETADHLDGTDPGDDGLALPRLRFDNLAIASLTELGRYMYFYGASTEIREVETAQLPDDAEITSDGREPLL